MSNICFITTVLGLYIFEVTKVNVLQDCIDFIVPVIKDYFGLQSYIAAYLYSSCVSSYMYCSFDAHPIILMFGAERLGVKSFLHQQFSNTNLVSLVLTN